MSSSLIVNEVEPAEKPVAAAVSWTVAAPSVVELLTMAICAVADWLPAGIVRVAGSVKRLEAGAES